MLKYFLQWLLAGFILVAPAFAGNQTTIAYPQVVKQINQLGSESIKHYTPNNAMTVIDGFSKLYFDYYEGSGMELAVAAISPDTNVKTEALFTQIIGDASKGAAPAELQKQWMKLQLQLNADLDLLKNNSANNFISAFFQAFSILLREGFEALLIVTALLTYLRRSGEKQQESVVYTGVATAICASIVTAVLFTTLFKNLGSHREAIEGLTMLFAAAVMFYVSYWLFAKRDAVKWQNFLKSKVAHAINARSATALGLAAFLAVYREGAETILFYQALLIGNPGQLLGIIAGFSMACVALLILYYAMKTASFKIPYRLFFTVTAVFLYAMSFSFIGRGILELQEAGWLNVTPIHGIPQFSWLGIFPAWQNIGAQLVFLVPTLAILIWWYVQQQTKRV